MKNNNNFKELHTTSGHNNNHNKNDKSSNNKTAGKPELSKKQRACDNCRVKKIKCDGQQRSQDGEKCTNCETSDITCTFIRPPIPKGPPKGYVESLENRNNQLESLIQRLNPGYDWAKEVGPPINISNFNLKESNKRKDPNSDIRIPITQSNPEEAANSESDNSDIDELEDKMRCMYMDDSVPILKRYYGLSSAAMLSNLAMDYGSSNQTNEIYNSYFRDDYWQDEKWMTEEKSLHNNLPILQTDYPPHELLNHLIDSYFINVNCTFPLLHKPTIIDNLNTKKFQSEFAGVILLVCAIGSQHSDDPRVLSSRNDPRFAGENFYHIYKLKCQRKSMLASPSIEEIQSLILTQIYFQGSTPMCKGSWSLNGTAISLIQDVGYHRIHTVRHDLLFNEFRKRVFYCSYILDVSLSSMFGRHTILNEDCFDVGLPSFLPDEIGKNDISIKYFKELIKLYSIHSEVIKILVSIMFFDLSNILDHY